MENAGAVTFLEDYVFRSRVTRSTYERRAETVLHEMAHMWFGDLVTMRWWDDLWLNESFATFASVLCQAAGHRVHRGVDDVRERREELGLPPGPAALHPPGRRRHPGPAGRRGQLRRDHLRQGRVGAQAARRLRRARAVPRRAARLLRRPTRGATPRSTTCSARWSRPRGATCRAGARSGCETTGLNLLRPSFDARRRRRVHPLRGRAGRRPARRRRAAHAPDRRRDLRRRRRPASSCAPTGSRWTSTGERTAGARAARRLARQARAGQRRRPHLLRAAAGPGLARHADRPDRRHRRAAAAHPVLVGRRGR